MALTHAMTPVEAARTIGRTYVEVDDFSTAGQMRTKRAYSQIADTVADLFDDIQVPVVFQSEDPYDDYRDMAETVAREQQLRVYNQHTDHRYFTHEEQLMFRAVHDWHGHLAADVNFRPEGEYRKWEHMCPFFDTEDQRRVMFAEVVGQVGAVFYLDDGFADPRFEQRSIIAPKWWVRTMRDAVEY